MGQGMHRILEPNEKVVWQGVMNRKVLVTLLVISLVVTFAIGIAVFAQQTISYTSNGQPKQMSGQAAGIGVIVIGLFVFLLGFFSNFVKEYAITQKRVVFKSGLIGTDFESVYLDQIKNIIVDVGLIGKIFGVGSVKIDIGKTETYSSGSSHPGTLTQSRIRTRTMYYVLRYVDNPYELYQYLQRSLTGRKESLYSGRADRESNPRFYA